MLLWLVLLTFLFVLPELCFNMTFDLCFLLQEIAGQPGTWSYHSSDGYPSGGPSTPGIPQQPRTPQPQQTPSQPQTPQPASSTGGGGTASQMYRQQSQQSVGVMSPQTPYSSSELQKQPSVSSLRDALLGPTPSSASQPPQYGSYNSSRVPPPGPEMMNQPSPMTPTANLPHTPDASTPAGGSSILSPPLKPPSYGDRQDSQFTESELLQTFSQRSAEATRTASEVTLGPAPARVSPFQVEKILGIKNDKPVDSLNDSSSQPQGFDQMPPRTDVMSSPSDGQAPFGEQGQLDGRRRARGGDRSSGDPLNAAAAGGRSDSLSTVESPTLGPHDNQTSPAMCEDIAVAKVIKVAKLTFSCHFFVIESIS